MANPAASHSIDSPVGATAVVLLNLGGPADLNAIRPFLRRMLADPAILRLPNPLRAMLARLIAHFRAPMVAKRYFQIGGGSPILTETVRQAAALQAVLQDQGVPVRCAMRYSHPSAAVTLDELRTLGIRTVIALPLYPQRSCTTTDSSLADLRTAAAVRSIRIKPISEYPVQSGWIAALVARLEAALAEKHAPILFTAHGLPELYLRGGDPYLDQVRATVAAVVAALAKPPAHLLGFQSRVGPVRWVGPDTGDVVRRLGREGAKSLIVCPISFVSEHLETLYDLDIDLANIARSVGIVHYRRIGTVQDDPRFIAGLAQLVRERLDGKDRQETTT